MAVKTYKVETNKWAVEVDGNTRGYIIKNGNSWTVTDWRGTEIAKNIDTRDSAKSFLDY